MKIIKTETIITLIDGKDDFYKVELFREFVKYRKSEKKWKISLTGYGNTNIKNTEIYTELLQKAIKIAKKENSKIDNEKKEKVRIRIKQLKEENKEQLLERMNRFRIHSLNAKDSRDDIVNAILEEEGLTY